MGVIVKMKMSPTEAGKLWQDWCKANTERKELKAEVERLREVLVKLSEDDCGHEASMCGHCVAVGALKP